MAGCMSRMSQEEIYFLKLDTVIKKIATPTVLKHFNALIPPNDLATTLNNNAGKIQDLYRKKVIKRNQLDDLVSVPGVNFPFWSNVQHNEDKSSENFDITLMICILRNLNFVQEPSSGWSNLPPKTDITLAANLTRIKFYRNKLAHLTKNEINENIFKRAWLTLGKALSEMSDGETDNVVREIETFQFETSDTDELLRKIQEQIKELKKEMQFHRNLKENTTSVLKNWENDLKKFYTTRGTQAVIQSIRTNDVVMIIGNSGTGKSTSMKYASLQLQREGYELFLISSPSDIPSQRFVDRKQLFIMDDVVGKYRVDDMALKLWERLHDRITVAFKDKGAKLLVTLRRQLHKTVSQIPSSIIFDSKVVDLDSDDLALSSDEKLGMLENYLENKNLSNYLNSAEKSVICSCTFAFPLLCNIFSSSEDCLKQRANFFQSPSIIFKRELDRLQEKNKKVYCVLALILIFDFEELKSIFDITCKCNIDRIELYHLVLSSCGVHEYTSRKSLRDHLQSVSGTFVESTNHFRFIHDNLEETIASHFGSRFPDVMLKCCKLQFIRDRVRLKTLPADDENVLILERSSFNVISERILKEIMNGTFRDVLLCEPMQDEQFVQYFISYVSKNNVSLDSLERLNCNENLFSCAHEISNIGETSLAKRFSLLEELQKRKNRFIHWMTAMGSLPLFMKVFDRQKTYLRQVYEKRTILNDLLHLAVLGENIEVIKLLIDKGGDVKSYDECGIPVLCKIAGTNRCDIAELLIDSGADVNQCDKVMGWTACFVASWFNEVDMLKYLISREASLNYMDFQGRVPLLLGVMKNNEQIVSVLLNNGAEIFDYVHFGIEVPIPMNSNYAIGTALANKNYKIVNLLRDFMKSRNTISVSFPSLANNSTLIDEKVDLFLNEIKSEASESALWKDNMATLDAVRYNDDSSLLHIFDKSENIVRYSFTRNALVVDKNRKKTLANFNQNYLRLSPLHVAALCDNVDAAKLLIKYGANPLQRDSRGRTSLHLAQSSAMLEILLSARCEPEVSSKLSTIKVLKSCLSLKFVPVLFKMLACSSADENINIKDYNGNTPLHSMIIRISDMDRCLDAVETLVNKGASTDIRCESGYLPIDHFIAVSLKFDNRVEERGERLLGGEETKRYIHREKLFYTSFMCVILVFFFWVYVVNTSSICIQQESIKESMIIPTKGIKWYASYTQIIVLLIMHWVCGQLNHIRQSFTFVGFRVTPTWSYVFSEQLFVTFSKKVAIAFIAIRGLCNLLDKSTRTDMFFNAYCIFLCLYFFIMFFPTPLRKMFRKHHSLCISAATYFLLFYLIIWALYVLILYTQSTADINIGFYNYYDLTDLFYFISFKLFLFYVYFCLFFYRLLRPLLFLLLEPAVWHSHYSADILCVCLQLFFIVDILSVPFSMIWCGLQSN